MSKSTFKWLASPVRLDDIAKNKVELCTQSKSRLSLGSLMAHIMDITFPFFSFDKTTTQLGRLSINNSQIAISVATAGSIRLQHMLCNL